MNLRLLQIGRDGSVAELGELPEQLVLLVAVDLVAHRGLGERGGPGDVAQRQLRQERQFAIVSRQPPRQLTLENALEFIADDELVEITPTAIRLRKRFLKSHERKRAAKPGA